MTLFICVSCLESTAHLPLSTHGCVGGWQTPVLQFPAWPEQSAYYGFPFSSLCILSMGSRRDKTPQLHWSSTLCHYLFRQPWAVVIAGHISQYSSNPVTRAIQRGPQVTVNCKRLFVKCRHNSHHLKNYFHACTIWLFIK